MRTPNSKCVICGKLMYRRPYELKKFRHVACMKHRAEAQKLSGITDAQLAGLALGSKKGTNHRTGYKHREESKRKCSEANKVWWAAHPIALKARGKKMRGPNHYNWKGGSSRLNSSIRRMTEHCKWMDGVKERDGCCIECGTLDNLESHHITEFANLIVLHGVKNREDARKCDALWDIENGETLCGKCHCKRHGKKYIPPKQGRRYKPKKPRRSMAGSCNPSWKGGLVAVVCLGCGNRFLVKPCEVSKRKYCSRKCHSEHRRANAREHAAASKGAV